MAFKKFGTGEIVKDSNDKQGLSKEAKQRVEWTKEDEQQLEAENRAQD